jgi:hypothetical protein
MTNVFLAWEKEMDGNFRKSGIQTLAWALKRQQLQSETRFHRVIAGTMADVVVRGFWHTVHADLNAPEFRKRLLRRVVSEQILRAQFVADFVECFIQLRNGSRVIIFAAGVI